MTPADRARLRELATRAKFWRAWGSDKQRFRDAAGPSEVLALLDAIESAERAGFAAGVEAAAKVYTDYGSLSRAEILALMRKLIPSPGGERE